MFSLLATLLIDTLEFEPCSYAIATSILFNKSISPSNFSFETRANGLLPTGSYKKRGELWIALTRSSMLNS